MTAGPDFGYGSQPGEYGDISDYGYGVQPGEYGVDTGHGVAAIVRDQAYGTNQGPAHLSHAVYAPRTSRRERTGARHVCGPVSAATRMLATTAVALIALVVGYRSADTTLLRARVSAYSSGDHRDVVTVHLDGTLGWSKDTLSIAVVDRTVGRPLRIVRSASLCGSERGHTTVRAPRNQPIQGICTLIVRVPHGRRRDHASVVLSVAGRQLPTLHTGLTLR